ncbi:NAD(P)/FAD-dependent oxidoreductase [Roseovarius pelagicus]|uniref:FAD-binding oxidoreductase n=1 Tax=Roseovarius pelagicus TaxID=2980108 RepID=A0ABY6D988_9RHOB|nr:FAD-binding oxidoreductase [Roseovarius pelagicus]UXX82709.1 FAD-binding oxidoreductase [Roseovarius pelagicus]
MMALRWTDAAKPGTPYWWDALENPAPDDPLPESCDLLVIGAGYTGLSAAIAAHDCGARVAVVDADIPGRGASTRNGGMFGAHPRLGWDELRRRFDAATADNIFAEAPDALAWARALIADEAIICDLQQTGRIQLAWSASHFENQKRLARTIRDKSTVNVQIVDRADLSTEITTEQYFGGIVFPEHCGLHPAKYHAGLIAAARRRGIPITGHARVQQVERTDAGHIASTPKGKIKARKVVLATNGYTTKPFRWQIRRVFALPSYLIATEPLPADLIAHLVPGGRMMVETRARHSYFRISPDGTRLLYGGRAAMVDVDLQTAAERLHATMCEVWPELEQTRLSHVWTGNTGYSFTHMPHVGCHDGVHYAMGFSGSGTVMAPYLGAKAAWQALGDPRGETAYSNTAFAPSWLHPSSNPHFLQAANLWYRSYVDWSENRQGRKRAQ